MRNAVLINLFVILASTSVFAGDGLPSYGDLVASTKDAVVNIQTTAGGESFSFFNNNNNRAIGWGSGFLISADGYIVTNRHVVEEYRRVRVVRLNGETYEGRVIGTDKHLDLALVKITASNLPYLKLADSDKARLGEGVIAMGYPLRMGFTVTSGIVSGRGRSMGGVNDMAAYIQTDADISYGSSGGPLINEHGDVIGMNTMIISQGETFGFAIPSNDMKISIDQLRVFGKVKRGALGVTLNEVSAYDRQRFGIKGGAEIERVYPNMPAGSAGISSGDIILSVDGHEVRGVRDIISSIGNKPPGSKITLKILAGGKESLKQIELGDRDNLLDDNN